MKNLDKNKQESYEAKKAELQHYKETVDIRDYLISTGYKLDKSRNTRNYNAYSKEETGDKIFVPLRNRFASVSYYVNQFDKNDTGSIIDFIRTREGKNLDEVRETLRSFKPGSFVEAVHEEKPQSAERDAQQLKKQRFVIEKIVGQKNLSDDTYLKSRFLEEAVIHDKAFKGKIFTNEAKDGRFTAFPIGVPEEKEVKGLAMKNSSQERFLGERVGMWVSNPTVSKRAELEKVVIAEHPIDAISYFQLNKDRIKKENTVLVSTAGNPSKHQEEELKKYLIKQSPKTVVLANDNDSAGNKFNQMFRQLVGDLNKSGQLKRPIEIEVQTPTFKDFTADVKARKLLEHRQLEQSDNSKPKGFDNLKPMSGELARLIEEKKYKEISRPDNIKALRESYIEKGVDGKIYAFSMRDVAIINNNRKLLALVESGQLPEKENKGKEVAAKDQAVPGSDTDKSKQVARAAHEAKQLLEGKATGEPGEPGKDRKEQLASAEKSIDKAKELRDESKSSTAGQEPKAALVLEHPGDVKQQTLASRLKQDVQAEVKEQPQVAIKLNRDLDLERSYYTTMEALQQEIKGRKDREQEYAKLQLYKNYPHLSDKDVDVYVQLQLSMKNDQSRQLEQNRFRHKGGNEIV